MSTLKAGIAAQQRGALSVGTPAWVPEGAIVYLDFQAGNYYAGGAEQSLADIFTADFDASFIDANGYLQDWNYPTNNVEHWPLAKGPLLDDMLAYYAAGFTMVWAAYDPTYTTWGTPFRFTDTAVPTSGNNSYAQHGDRLAIEDSWWGSLHLSSFSLYTAGIENVTAITFGRDLGGGSFEYGCSINGQTPESNTRTYHPKNQHPATSCAFASWGQTFNTYVQSNGFASNERPAYWRRMILFPAVPAANLATYSVM